jgi:hypothetical protein
MRVKKIFIIVGVALLLVISGCSRRGQITSFQGHIETIISDNEIHVDCSDAVNKNKKGSINTIAYIFTVQLDEDSKIIGKNNEHLSIGDLKEKIEIEVIFSNPIYIDETRIGTAKEVRVLE